MSTPAARRVLSLAIVADGRLVVEVESDAGAGPATHALPASGLAVYGQACRPRGLVEWFAAQSLDPTYEPTHPAVALAFDAAGNVTTADFHAKGSP